MVALLTSNHQYPNTVRLAEQNETQDAGAQHAHPPELLAEKSGPWPGLVARLHSSQEMSVGHQGPGQ